MNKRLMAEYRRFRRAGVAPGHALSAARTELQWERLEFAGFVKLTAQPDEDYDWQPEDAKYRDDGAWGVVGWFTLEPEAAEFVDPEFRRGPWTQGDSVWGSVGYLNVLSATENSYVTDIKRATIDEFATALRGRYCPLCHRRTA